MSQLRVGLTGGLAGGKSTVAGLLRRRGYRVVDADRLVAELYRPQGAGARAVGQEFGEAYLGPDGGVDHRRLAQTVFQQEDARRRLEALVHPLVRERFAALAAEVAGIAVLEATLLVEAGYAPDFDLIVTVEATEETRRLRARQRGMTDAEARARIAAQGSGDARRAAADLRIDNDGTLAELEADVDELAGELERRLASRAAAEETHERSRR